RGTATTRTLARSRAYAALARCTAARDTCRQNSGPARQTSRLRPRVRDENPASLCGPASCTDDAHDERLACSVLQGTVLHMLIQNGVVFQMCTLPLSVLC